MHLNVKLYSRFSKSSLIYETSKLKALRYNRDNKKLYNRAGRSQFVPFKFSLLLMTKTAFAI